MHGSHIPLLWFYLVHHSMHQFFPRHQAYCGGARIRGGHHIYGSLWDSLFYRHESLELSGYLFWICLDIDGTNTKLICSGVLKYADIDGKRWFFLTHRMTIELTQRRIVHSWPTKKKHEKTIGFSSHHTQRNTFSPTGDQVSLARIWSQRSLRQLKRKRSFLFQHSLFSLKRSVLVFFTSAGLSIYQS